MADFEQFKIKEYNYWAVFLHENQGYLGRCVIWCKRENALDLAEAALEEREELLIIIKELKMALMKAFQTDWFNYAFLGNETRHLHCHFIPRYQTTREFGGVVFKDDLWGHNYRTDHNFKISNELTQTIKRKIQAELQQKTTTSRGS